MKFLEEFKSHPVISTATITLILMPLILRVGVDTWLLENGVFLLWLAFWIFVGVVFVKVYYGVARISDNAIEKYRVGRRCPFCAEIIQPQAMVCPYCRQTL